MLVWVNYKIQKSKRLSSWKKGYMKGCPDLMIYNNSGNYCRFAIEFKTPKGTHKLSLNQKESLKKLSENGWKTLVTNDYFECIKQIYTYNQFMKIKCEFCEKTFKKIIYTEKNMWKNVIQKEITL